MTKACTHDAWENLGGGSRRCADCKVILDRDHQRTVMVDATPHTREGFGSGSSKTFADALTRHFDQQPRVWNGVLSLRRFRITAEVIDEPIDVLRDRLRKLWRETERNMHARPVMQEAADELGITLDVMDQGVDHPRARTRSKERRG